jgi:Na+-translocating ferredoxin:NAD+ oxidoreductase RNF subunit RnfB
MSLNFVLLIWEERNLGCYEHARACQERARAARAKKIHQPSNDIRNSKLCVHNDCVCTITVYTRAGVRYGKSTTSTYSCSANG